MTDLSLERFADLEQALFDLGPRSHIRQRQILRP